MNKGFSVKMLWLSALLSGAGCVVTPVSRLPPPPPAQISRGTAVQIAVETAESQGYGPLKVIRAEHDDDAWRIRIIARPRAQLVVTVDSWSGRVLRFDQHRFREHEHDGDDDEEHGRHGDHGDHGEGHHREHGERDHDD